MGKIKDSGNRTEFDSGAVRDMHEGKGRFDLLPMCVLTRLARHYENGCQKYGDRNWEKGIPCHSFADSAMRLLLKRENMQRTLNANFTKWNEKYLMCLYQTAFIDADAVSQIVADILKE